MPDWARKKMQFLSTKCISATKKKISFSSWSKMKCKDVKKDLKKHKELAYAQEGTRALSGI